MAKQLSGKGGMKQIAQKMMKPRPQRLGEIPSELIKCNPKINLGSHRFKTVGTKKEEIFGKNQSQNSGIKIPFKSVGMEVPFPPIKKEPSWFQVAFGLELVCWANQYQPNHQAKLVIWEV